MSVIVKNYSYPRKNGSGVNNITRVYKSRKTNKNKDNIVVDPLNSKKDSLIDLINTKYYFALKRIFDDIKPFFDIYDQPCNYVHTTQFNNDLFKLIRRYFDGSDISDFIDMLESANFNTVVS